LKTTEPASLLIEAHYLPCLDYMAGLVQTDRVRIEAAEHYRKQSYRNRCYVRSAHAIERLTVPVVNGTHRQISRDIRIDYSRDWISQHWRCWQAAYGKAPFFEFYAPELEPAYRQKPTFLLDLTVELLTICLNLLGIRANLSLTTDYEPEPDADVFDARSRLTTLPSATEGLFGFARPYAQNFGPDFVSNLSIVDLLFCAGPDSLSYLNAGRYP
jgi:hypothetical protein